MKQEIAVDGKSLQVEVVECTVGTPLSVRVNGKSRTVLLEEEPDCRKPFKIKVDGNHYAVELTMIDSKKFLARVNNMTFEVTLRPTIRKIATPTGLQRSALTGKSLKMSGEEGVVVAPMTGRIISINAKKGDPVKTGDVLCILEAMKMENEILAPKNGLVEEVKVQEGKAVNEGDTLIVIR